MEEEVKRMKKVGDRVECGRILSSRQDMDIAFLNACQP